MNPESFLGLLSDEASFHIGETETVHFQHFPYDFFWILCLYILAFLNNHLSFSPI